MKINKKLLAKYNTPDTIVVVSLYPKKGEVYSAGASGVASYTKNVVKEMDQKVVVIADKLGSKSTQYEEDNSLVARVWCADHKHMWLEVLAVLKQLPHIKSLLIHFDFSMYGGMITSGLIVPFLATVRLLGIEPTIVSHHVIKDVRKLSGQVGLGHGLLASLMAALYNGIFHAFYWILGVIAKNIIVLEEPLQQRLEGIVSRNKIVAIPHAVDTTISAPDKRTARKRLGFKANESVVMFFGYINWFKGADFFTKSVADIDQLNGKKVRFVVAGGASPTMKSKRFYQKFYMQVVDHVESSKTLELTGYVPQDRIADYFAAADLVVLPYREFMCASGVMSLVLSYQKPFVISDRLRPMLSSPDFTLGMKKARLRSMDMTFLLNKNSLVEVMERVLENGLKSKLKDLAGYMRQTRSFSSTANLYQAALSPKIETKPTKIVKGALAYAKASV